MLHFSAVMLFIIFPSLTILLIVCGGKKDLSAVAGKYVSIPGDFNFLIITWMVEMAILRPPSPHTYTPVKQNIMVYWLKISTHSDKLQKVRYRLKKIFMFFS